MSRKRSSSSRIDNNESVGDEEDEEERTSPESDKVRINKEQQQDPTLTTIYAHDSPHLTNRISSPDPRRIMSPSAHPPFITPTSIQQITPSPNSYGMEQHNQPTNLSAFSHNPHNPEGLRSSSLDSPISSSPNYYQTFYPSHPDQHLYHSYPTIVFQGPPSDPSYQHMSNYTNILPPTPTNMNFSFTPTTFPSFTSSSPQPSISMRSASPLDVKPERPPKKKQKPPTDFGSPQPFHYFQLQDQPTPRQRKSLKSEVKYINPNPLVIKLRENVKPPPPISHGTVSVTLLNRNLGELPNDCFTTIDGEKTKHFDQDFSVKFSIRILNLLDGNTFSIQFSITLYDVNGVTICEEKIISHPFIMVNNPRRNKFEPTTVADMKPKEGPATVSTEVWIKGRGFPDDVTVTFGGHLGLVSEVVDNLITVHTPARPDLNEDTTVPVEMTGKTMQNDLLQGNKFSFLYKVEEKVLDPFSSFSTLSSSNVSNLQCSNEQYEEEKT